MGNAEPVLPGMHPGHCAPRSERAGRIFVYSLAAGSTKSRARRSMPATISASPIGRPRLRCADGEIASLRAQ
jgi:hypothetical protein